MQAWSESERHRIVKLSVPGTALAFVGAVLVAAKIWGGLDWPWWLVTLPLWIVVGIAALTILILVGLGFLFLLAAVFGGR